MVIQRRPARSRVTRLLLPLVGAAIVLGVIAVSKWEGQWVSQHSGATQGVASQQTHTSSSSAGSSTSSGSSSDRRGRSAAAGAVKAAAAEQQRAAHGAKQRKPVTDAIKALCGGTVGTWCIDYFTQIEVPAKTAPRGNKTCSLDCNQVGVCNALSGLCTCPAGWSDFNCLHPMKRYCTHKFRDWGLDVPRVPPNFTESRMNPAPFTFQNTVSRCAGFCDEVDASCYCPSNTTYGRIPAPLDAPPGAPPVQRGRPMPQYCQPNTTEDGTQTGWGFVDWQDLYGPQGWCMAEKPKIKCDCFHDGIAGETCEIMFEAFCFNQCNGRGECQHGYCKCDPGWHGIDCAHRSEYADASVPGREVDRPWVAEHVHTPAAQDFPPGATRKRPLIFVYELPSDYTTLMLQYRRSAGGGCTARHYNHLNETMFSLSLYNLESGFLEMLLQSEHRTLDPEEADFFFVPTFTSCYIEHVRGLADSLRDTMYGLASPRVHGATQMMLEAFHWIQAHYPYWDRRGGRDHIWLATFDEASCYVPSAVRSSIILSQWGRKDLNHTSGTGYWEDEYSTEFKHPQWEPDGFLWKIAGHACYDPVKDLVLPSMKTPTHYRSSPLIGAHTRNRTWLAFHRGRVQPDNIVFSRGLRQRLAAAAKERNWLERYNIAVGEHDAISGDYSEMLASSIFCLYLPGDGWSARMEDAMLHGCIPAIIVDNVDVSFESILDYPSFTIRIPEADAEKLPEILQAVPEERRQEMRAALVKVWNRYTWNSYRPFAKAFRELQAKNREKAAGKEPPPTLSLPATVPDLDPEADDAFTTVMAWLHSRIEATR